MILIVEGYFGTFPGLLAAFPSDGVPLLQMWLKNSASLTEELPNTGLALLGLFLVKFFTSTLDVK